MLIFEHRPGFQMTRSKFNFMDDGKLKIQFRQEFGGDGKVISNSTLLTEAEAKQLANFIVAYYRGEK